MRYKTIKQNPEAFSTYVKFNTLCHFNLLNLKREVERKWKSVVEETLASSPLVHSHEIVETGPNI